MGEKRKINLLGPEGNAFMLMAICQHKAEETGMDWEAIQADAIKGDYEHLVDVLEKHFGEYFEFSPS